MKQVIIATKNPGKAKEFKAFFQAFDMEARSLLDFADEIPDVEETGSTFEENAALKAETIAARLQKPVLSDDSGLCIDALDGRPGIYSARFAGLEKNDVKNMEKALHELANVPYEKRTAHFVCVMAIAQPNKETIYKRGTCQGHIALEPKGNAGFGYDPIFIPDGYDKSMAELGADVKSKISHRKHAMDQLEAWLKENKAIL